MRTNVEIDDELMNQALKLSKLKTKKDIINEALKKYISHHKGQAMKSLQGKVEWIGDLDKMRTYDKWEGR